LTEYAARRILSILNFRIKKLATNALADMAVTKMNTEWKPLMYDSSIAVFWGPSAMARRTKIYCSESLAICVGRPSADSLLDMAFWKTVPDSWRLSVWQLGRSEEIAYRDADRHTEATEEAIHASSHSTVLNPGDGLDTNVDAGQDHAGAYTKESKGHCNDYQPGMKIEDDEETASECCDGPTEPNSPSKSSKPRGYGCNNNGARNEETDGREQVDACMSW
jgi:hypothetical protein